MPCEIRYLVFSEGEVVISVHDYYRKLAKILPSPANSIARIDGGDQPFVVLSAGKDRSDTNLKVEGERLLASLILFCHKKRIPLPVRGSKELSLVNGRLALLVKLPMEPALNTGTSRSPSEVRQWLPNAGK